METKLTNEEIKDFFNKCSSHDWYYAMSDDGRVFRNGVHAEKILINNAGQHELYKRIYNDWHDYIFSGKSFGNEPKERPELSNYIQKKKRMK